MDTRLLIEGIVHQTTVLIAQLSTAAGIRAPLSHVADQVFLELAQEIEAQGVGRKVVADMFGLALRSYQKKVQRLTASVTRRDRSLWQAVLAFVEQHEPCARDRVTERFRLDDENAVGAVLADLVQGGFVVAEGRGDHATYRLATDADREALGLEQRASTLSALVWLRVHEAPRTRQELAAQLPFARKLVDEAVDLSIKEGHLEESEGVLRISHVVVPIGAKQGWELAVLDHFRAMATALAAKVTAPVSAHGDRIGGSTVTLDVHDDHPARDEVLSLLARTRDEATRLWTLVSEHNKANPVPEERRTTVRFYFGQHVQAPTSED